MTLPRLYTDPRLGVSYPVGSILPSADENAERTGLAAHDLAIETQISANWPDVYTYATFRNPFAAAWIPTSACWVVALQDAGTPANPAAERGYPHTGSLLSIAVQPAAEEGLTVKDICAFGDYAVMCGDPGASSNHKYRHSADGGNNWGSGHSSVTSATSVNAVCHHYTTGGAVSLFVSGAEGGVVETSPTGATWTGRTAVNANDIIAMASNGVIVVAVTSASSDKCVTTVDGEAWVERTMATTAYWYDVCWVAQQSRWVALGVSGGNIIINKSADGATWEAVTILSGLNVTLTPVRIVSTGNLVVLAAGDGVYSSVDLGANWILRREFSGAGASVVLDLAVATDSNSVPCQLLAVGSLAPTDTYYFGSHIGS